MGEARRALRGSAARVEAAVLNDPYESARPADIDNMITNLGFGEVHTQLVVPRCSHGRLGTASMSTPTGAYKAAGASVVDQIEPRLWKFLNLPRSCGAAKSSAGPSGTMPVGLMAAMLL